MNKPTQKQIAYLQHLGVTDLPESKEQGTEWISTLQEGVGLDEATAFFVRSQVKSWASVRQTKHPDLYPPPSRQIEILKSKLSVAKAKLKTETTVKKRAEINADIKYLLEEIEGCKEHIQMDKEDARYKREEARADKEDARLRLHDLWEAMGSEGYFSDKIRKPTQAQVKACIEELDITKPGWFEEYPSDLLDILLFKFPDLAKSNSKTRKKSKQSKSGCLVIFLFIAVIAFLSLTAKFC